MKKDGYRNFYEPRFTATIKQCCVALFNVGSLRCFYFYCLFGFSNFSLAQKSFQLNYSQFDHYIDYFNKMEDEPMVQAISIADVRNWMQENIPLLKLLIKQLRKYFISVGGRCENILKATPQGYVITEFWSTGHADKYNLISSALGHHIYEAHVGCIINNILMMI